MIGQTLDHYRVLAQIGEGGMGVVYRARDEVLNRDVALKLLARGALDKVSPGHLLREAQTASSLSHPNICTIHQVGETGNDFYVVMELIEGRSLRDLITATGLSMEIVTPYGTQIADACAHAHDRGDPARAASRAAFNSSLRAGSGDPALLDEGTRGSLPARE